MSISNGFFCTHKTNRTKESKIEILSTLNLICNRLVATNVINIENKNEEVINPIDKPNFLIKFTIVPTKNIKNILVIENKSGIDVNVIFERLSKYKSKLKHIINIIPAENLIFDNYKTNIKNFFNNKKENIIGSYKIEYKERCNNLDLKNDIFKIILNFFENNPVNLTQPNNIISIQSVKNIYGVAIIKVKNYKENEKFITSKLFNFSEDYE